MSEIVIDNDVQKTRWKNRRRMAWLSLLSMIIFTVFILFTPLIAVEKLKVLSEVITWFYLAMASVVGSYMGFTTWASIRGKDG